MKNGHGGKRPGSGKPKGVKWPSTLDKEQARELVRQMVCAAIRPLVEAQISNATGIRYLVVRQKSTGKFLRRVGATGETHDPDTELIEIWEKDPSVQAFSDLMNRALDKAKEQEQEIKITGEAELIAKLLAGRKRAAEARAGTP